MKHFKYLILFASFLLILTVLTVLSAFSKRIPQNPAGTIGNTPGNLHNGGLFCEDEKRVYFSNAYDQGALYSMNPDESDVKKLSESQVSSLNAAGNYLYYYQSNSSASDRFSSMFRTNGLYRSKKDGSDATCLKRVPVPSLSLWENTIFYQSYSTKTGTSLRRIGIDKTEDEELADYVIDPSCLQEGSLYFGGTKKDHALYAMDCVSGMIQPVYAGNVYQPIVCGDYVYYMDISSDYRLCRYSLTEQSVQVLTDDRLDFFNVYEDMIYYQKSDAKAPALKRILIDGSGEEVIAEGIYEQIHITSRYVYFNEYQLPTPIYHTPLRGAVSVEPFTPQT